MIRKRHRPARLRFLDRLIAAGWGGIPLDVIPEDVQRVARTKMPMPPTSLWSEVAWLYATDREGRARQRARAIGDSTPGVADKTWVSCECGCGARFLRRPRRQPPRRFRSACCRARWYRARRAGAAEGARHQGVGHNGPINAAPAIPAGARIGGTGAGRGKQLRETK